nr:shikimate kinase [uncultured Sellimonas sp.]
MKHIFLTGFMGTGKTVVSKRLGKKLNRTVLDMDNEIEKQEQMKISQIFSEKGEEYFRQAETEYLKKLGEEGAIVSCGGGVPLRDENIREMKKSGYVILLTARPETIFYRVKNSHTRPKLENNKNVEYIRNLLEEREAYYKKAADMIVETDGKTANEVTEEIVNKVNTLYF